MSKTLVIAEKPSVASDLAKALGVKKTGDFFENEQFVISSAVGHLLELAPPAGAEPARGKWKIENLPSLPEHFDLVPIEKNANRLAILRRLLKRKDVTEVINACDAGREGELIFRNLIKATGVNKPSKRLWLQSMTTEAIRGAFQRLRPDAEMQPLADAAVSRSEADWLVGINSTRALTAFNSQGGGFNKTTSGRVQTPTLAILADREQKIRAFKPRTYFEVFGDFGVSAGNYRGRWFDPGFRKASPDDEGRAERIWEKSQADAILAKCLGRPGIVEEKKQPTTQAPPLLYDLTTLQREANSRFGFPAKMTLQLAQALYEKHKALTYPRTDSRYLPEDHLSTAQRVLGDFPEPALANFAAKALEQGWVRPNKRIFNNAKVSDHFAIVPTGTAPKSLSETEQKIFDMVARRFIAVFYPAAQFEVTTRITTVEGEKFKTDGKIVIDPGWLAVYGRQSEGNADSDKVIVALRAGEEARTESLEIKESETKPPARYSEATLLSAMEGAGKLIDDEELREAMTERGLGTPATRAQIIEGLINEGYVIRQQRELIVTAKGISLITLLRNLHAETLTKPELTGEWESKLKRMERGELSRTEFMSQIRLLTKDVVDKVRQGMGQEVRGEFHALEVQCPKCQQGPFKESFRAYECPNPECKLIVWKSMAGRELEREEVIKLLSERKVGPLEGFRSKLGRPFAAVITIGEDFKQKFDFENEGGGESGDPITPINEEPLGICQVCKTGKVFETANAFICEQVPQKKCTFRMGKLILQREIPRSQVIKLLETGKTDLLPKFISSKTKRAFSAYLKLGEGGKVGFEFEPRTKKPPKGAAKEPVEAKEPTPAKQSETAASDDIPF